jgi:hypothetical protein
MPVFPTIPTVADGRVVGVNQLNTTATLTGPNLNLLTKQPGDLLIAIAGEYQSDAGADAAFTGWAGGGLTWTEIRDSTGTAVNRLGVAFARVITGSETGTVTVTRSGTLVGDASMILLCIPGAHASTAPEASVMATGTTAAADPAALDPAGWGTEDTLWIGANGNGMTNATSTWTANNSAPTDYTDFFGTNPADTSTIGDFGLAVAFRQNAVASEDMGGFGQDLSNARNSALVIAVRPTINRTGTATPTQDDQTSTASGTVAEGGTSGTVAVTQDNQTSAATGTVPELTTVNRSIIAGSDDAKEPPSNIPELATATILLDVVGYHMGLRFTDLPIQNAATIVTAAVSMSLTDSAKNDAEGTWYAHASDDASTFTVTNADVDGRTKTTASVAWTTNDLGTAGTRVTSPSLVTIVQEIVNRAGWQPGNNIAFLYVHNSATDKIEIGPLEHATAVPPSLAVEYFPIPIVEGRAEGHWTFTGTAIGTIGGADITGSAAAIQADQTSTATGVLGYTGTSAQTQADQTSTASGVLGYTGTAAATQDDQTSTASGTSAAPGNSGAVAATQDDQTAIAAGVLGYTGTSAVTQADQTSTATGTSFAPGVSGAVAATQADQTSTATGVLGYTGTSTTTQADQTSTATGWITITGLVAVIQVDQTSTASGTVGGVVAPPGIWITLQDTSHAITVVDPVRILTLTDSSKAVLVVDGTRQVVVSDIAKTATVQDPEHSLVFTSD